MTFPYRVALMVLAFFVVDAYGYDWNWGKAAISTVIFGLIFVLGLYVIVGYNPKPKNKDTENK